jgi:hypothetical protein
MGIGLSPRLKSISLKGSVVGGLALWLGSFACNQPAATPPPALPESPWGGRYAYSYELPGSVPRAKAGSVPITIAVVNPSYRETDSALASPLYSGVGKGLTLSMGTDLDKILIAKGVTTTGPFASIDEITYSEKKGADLTLAPKVFIAAEYKQGEFEQVNGVNRQESHFELNVTGWVTFIMQEPMTGEKMWIKKLEIEPVHSEGVIAQEVFPQYANNGGCGGPQFVGYQQGKVLMDGRADAMANALKEIYPVVLERFYKYLETEEMVQLKSKSQEIRASKVYNAN